MSCVHLYIFIINIGGREWSGGVTVSGGKDKEGSKESEEK
jgi:hypothetical protein